MQELKKQARGTLYLELALAFGGCVQSAGRVSGLRLATEAPGRLSDLPGLSFWGCPCLHRMGIQYQGEDISADKCTAAMLDEGYTTMDTQRAHKLLVNAGYVMQEYILCLGALCMLFCFGVACV